MPVFINEVVAELADPEVSETSDRSAEAAPQEAQPALEALALESERLQRLLVD